MEIYVVQQGDDIVTIADKYSITVEKLISDNGLMNPYSLVAGQALIILTPKVAYTVKQGDTLATIADSNDISLMHLIRNNPFLYDREFIYPDESLVLHYDSVKDIQVNGFTYVFLNQETIIRALPYLTFISILNYRIAENAKLIVFGDDSEIIRLAKEYDTIPLLMISAFSQTGEIDLELVYEFLLNSEHQDSLIFDMLEIMKTKDFKGINFLVSNITEYNQDLYINVFSKLSTALRNEGYIFMLTISPNYDLTYTNLDYQRISILVDRIIFLQNIWGKNNQPPSPISNISFMKPFIEQVTSIIPSSYVSLGKPIVGYDWQLPFVPNFTRAKLMSLNSTIALASEQSAVIQFDDVSQTPYYNYTRFTDGAPENHVVWFIDARSLHALDDIIIEYDLVGTGLWYLTGYNQQLYSMINAHFNIIKFTTQ